VPHLVPAIHQGPPQQNGPPPPHPPQGNLNAHSLFKKTRRFLKEKYCQFWENTDHFSFSNKPGFAATQGKKEGETDVKK